MSAFDEFIAANGEGGKCRSVDEGNIAAFVGKLPDELLLHWKGSGWCSYANGFFWFVNPSDYTASLKEWVGRQANHMFVFARTGFGDLFVWGKEGVYVIYVHAGRMSHFTDDLALFVNYTLTLKEYLNETLAHPFFKRALKKLGALEYDEIYAFAPALALGGSGALDTVVKAKIHEHLSILAQLHGNIE